MPDSNSHVLSPGFQSVATSSREAATELPEGSLAWMELPQLAFRSRFPEVSPSCLPSSPSPRCLTLI